MCSLPDGLHHRLHRANSTVPTDGSYNLLPGVLQAYRISAADLPAYQPPVPGPLPLLGAASALAWSRRLRRRIPGPLSRRPPSRGNAAKGDGGGLPAHWAGLPHRGGADRNDHFGCRDLGLLRNPRECSQRGRSTAPTSIPRHSNHVDPSFFLSLRSLRPH